MLVNYSKISYYFVVEAMSLMYWSKNEKYGSEKYHITQRHKAIGFKDDGVSDSQ